MNKCFSSGGFPEKVKYAIITPIHKKGDNTITNHFSYISVTCFL